MKDFFELRESHKILDESKGTGVKKFVRGMRVQNLNGGSKGTVIKGGDNLKKAVEVEWDNGQTTLASAKYLKSIKKNESVELGEAKLSVGDRVTLQPNKNTLDRSLIGKAGVVTGMLGSKPTVKFANGQTIVVSPKDLKINESVDEARKDASADLYFNTYSAAVQYAKAQAEKKGYEVDEDDWQDKVATGPRKPSKDKTVRHTLKLTKNGKPVRQGLSIQVYNRGSDKNPYELNYYVS